MKKAITSSHGRRLVERRERVRIFGVERDLRKDPSLVKNPEFLSRHPEFSEYLGKHPAVKADLVENPKAFMRREAQYEKNEKREIREERHEAAAPRQAAATH